HRAAAPAFSFRGERRSMPKLQKGLRHDKNDDRKRPVRRRPSRGSYLLARPRRCGEREACSQRRRASCSPRKIADTLPRAAGMICNEFAIPLPLKEPVMCRRWIPCLSFLLLIAHPVPAQEKKSPAEAPTVVLRVRSVN